MNNEVEMFKDRIIDKLEFLVEFYLSADNKIDFQEIVVGIQEAIGVVEEEYLQLGGK